MHDVVLVGLGNVGSRFTMTRHNAGMRTLFAWAEGKTKEPMAVSPWRQDRAIGAEIFSVRLQDGRHLWALLPTTMMNDSGKAIAAFLRHHSVTPDSILIIHDDLETEFGTVKMKAGGSAKGHNGVRSIQEQVGQDMPRLLLGVGRPVDMTPIEAFVLQPFSHDQETAFVQTMMPQALEMIDEFCRL